MSNRSQNKNNDVQKFFRGAGILIGILTLIVVILLLQSMGSTAWGAACSS